ncbi:sugar phosphate isomerase/epimerase family protein [Subtercola sp. YIM 133946]|uniref:sugar phosphate isomerase/epimerase family protein n=1 Tax=Subtercola sp. YIM 133946 TaxID=3118909 RepID=UPI002F944D47
MTLAVSNIAWPADEEAAVAQALADLSVSAVEIAPTKVFADPLAASDEQVADYLSFWADHGVSVVAFQSMLFGRPELTVFDDSDVRRATQNHLAGFIDLAARMGASVLVFGSPKNRRVPPGMSDAEADDIAADFFGLLGEIAAASGTQLLLEPNPTAYDCNYVYTAQQGSALVARVANQGFGLHLDVAGMTLAGDDSYTAITGNPHISHFHVSAPQLGEIEETEVDHDRAARALAAIDYRNVVSIEMRPGAPGEAADRVRRAVGVARRHYADVL